MFVVLKRILRLPIVLISLALVLILTAGGGQALADRAGEGDRPVEATPTEVTVFRSPTCGCCGLWADHMRESGFDVDERMMSDMDGVKQELGVTPAMASCHTAIVGHYILEGHVPASDVQRLLAAQPDVAGIAAPGMPMGSPGMEQDGRVDPYTVFSFDEAGNATPFAEHS